jgi:hypothetical protein
MYFGLRNEVREGWRKLRGEELHVLYSAPNIRVIKSRIMKRVWNVT